MALTLKITPRQAYMLLHNVGKGKSISALAGDLFKIIDAVEQPKKKFAKEDISQSTANPVQQPLPPNSQPSQPSMTGSTV